MFTCSHCGYEFRYREALGMASGSGVGKKCPSCSNTNYYTAKSRKKGLFYVLIMSFVIIFLTTIDFSTPMLFSILLAVLIVYYFLSPFIYELTDHEEPLW